MKPEEYQKVKAVFQSVLETEPQKRAKFLDKTCKNNPDLRQEVERLLKNLESGFMEDTAIQNVADLIVDEESLISGEKIGRFQIISRLGKGGMGEVYLAHDKSLNRDVAIKVLLPEFSSDRERVNRFKLEAKAASALNHPNIITIYEVGEDDGKLFIATEHIIGETLRSLIEQGKLDLASSIRIAEQIASALTAAHHAGIIHRDIKPENIMVREDGFVKVLDFGLAKPTIVNPEAETMDLVETKKGMIMGSVGYMSPEQARGKVVDARTDLWSIGVVFYEMLTGKTPFQGDTMTDILANIIHKEPLPISEQLPDNPTELYRIVKKSLRKEADERYQTSKDLSLDLKNLRREMELEHELELSVSPERLQKIKSRSNDLKKTADKENETQILSEPLETQTSVEITKVRSRYRTGILAAIGVLIIGALSYFGYDYFKPKKLVDTAFRNAKIEKLPITGKIDSVIISPDGKYLAYIEGNLGINGRLMLRQLETGSEKEIVKVNDAIIELKSFSPDSNYFFFSYNPRDETTNSLRRIALLGGEILDVQSNVNSTSNLSFSPDGARIIFARLKKNNSVELNEIVTCDLNGENESVIYSSAEIDTLNPQFSPDGTKILVGYNDNNQPETKIALGWLPASGGEITRIGESNWDARVYNRLVANFAWLKDGSGIVIVNKPETEYFTQIFTLNFPNGDITRIIKDFSQYRGLSLTSDNKTAVSIKQFTSNGIFEFDLQTKKSRQISEFSSFVYRKVLPLPNNEVLLVKDNGKGDRDILMSNNDVFAERNLVTQKGKIDTPILSNDEKKIYFATNVLDKSPNFGENGIWQINLDGSNPVKIKNISGGVQDLIGVFPDQNNLLVMDWKENPESADIVVLNLETGNTSKVIGQEKGEIHGIDLSPDGKQILFGISPRPTEQDSHPKIQIKLVEFDGTKIGETNLILSDEAHGWVKQFAYDGKAIYYSNNRNRADIWKFDFATQKSTKITNFNVDQISNFAVSRDGKKIYIVRGNTTDEVVLIKNVE